MRYVFKPGNICNSEITLFKGTYGEKLYFVPKLKIVYSIKYYKKLALNDTEGR